MPFALAPIAAVPARVVTSSRARVASRAPLVATRPVHHGTIHNGRGRISTTPRASLDPVAVNDALFQLAANANELVDGCGVNGTCGNVEAPPFALIGGAIVISAAVLFSVRDDSGRDALSARPDPVAFPVVRSSLFTPAFLSTRPVRRPTDRRTNARSRSQVTFGLKGGADAAAEMQDRDKDFFGKK